MRGRGEISHPKLTALNTCVGNVSFSILFLATFFFFVLWPKRNFVLQDRREGKKSIDKEDLSVAHDNYSTGKSISWTMVSAR